MRSERRNPHVDDALARIGAANYGLVSKVDALAAGETPSGIARRLNTGEWKRVYRGLYRFAAVPRSWEQSVLAPCLRRPGFAWACGRTAARFWSLDDCDSSVVEVLTTAKLRRLDDVLIHQVNHVPGRHVTVVRGIPVTTIHRTLCDLGNGVGPEAVEIALESALRRKITSVQRLWRTIDELGTKGRRGPAVLAELLRRQDGRATESALETKCAQFLRRYRLPSPSRQVRIRAASGALVRVDFYWNDVGVVLEVDGRAHHTRRETWERDLRRRNGLVASGRRVLHATYERLGHDTHGLAQEILRALAQGPEREVPTPPSK